MKLSWKDYAIIFALLLVTAVIVTLCIKQSVQTEDVEGTKVQVIKNHLFKVKA